MAAFNYESKKKYFLLQWYLKLHTIGIIVVDTKYKSVDRYI